MLTVTPVAPYVGAWIETHGYPWMWSEPPVAPYVGAWIETSEHRNQEATKKLSHPTWVRGLKLSALDAPVAAGTSHPTWVRGLKLYLSREISIPFRRTLRGCVD